MAKNERQTGSVKWFDAVKGFGFIKVDGSEKDLFVHYSDIDGDGYKTLEESDHVSFEVAQSGRGPKAAKVKIIK